MLSARNAKATLVFLLEEADDPRKAGTMTLGCELRT